MSVTLAVDGLRVDLSGNRVLDGIGLAVPAGTFATLLGPSGSGKTTTLNVLAGFTEPTSGEVLMDGRSLRGVPANRRDIGLVFQNYALFPHLTVAQNIEFPLLARKIGKARRRRMVAEALELVQLPGVGDRRVLSLSGGQQQRIALARALVFSPSLLLLDEPLAALDKQLREAMQLELKRIQRETGTTTVAVTHDQVEALSMSDTVAIMNRGRIEQVGTPEEVYHRPATLFVARFLGEANLLAVRSGRVEVFGMKVEGATEGTTVIRPEDLRLTRPGDPGTLTGRVIDVVYQGARLRLTVAVPGCPDPLIVGTVPSDTPVRPTSGDEVGIAYRGTGLATLHPSADPAKPNTAMAEP